MSLSKSGYSILLVGVLLLVVSIFFTADWSIEAWLILFIASILFCATGIILLIIRLVRQIRSEKLSK